MLEYLKKAFWLGPDVPGLGRLPVNALGILGFGILGFGHPAFWLLGAGIEAAYLALTATHPRLQRVVDAERRRQSVGQEEDNRVELVRKLDPQVRKRLVLLEEKAARVLQIQRDAQAGDFALTSSREALEHLQWIYLKLLVARHHLESSQHQASQADLKKKIEDLERGLAAEGSSASLRSSQKATLEILRQRLENFEHGGQTLKEIESDLARIEAQVDLALESATVRGGGFVVSANIELASRILDDGLYFGDSETAVMTLDQAYGAPPKTRDRA